MIFPDFWNKLLFIFNNLVKKSKDDFFSRQEIPAGPGLNPAFGLAC
jgi:hypothetical protein